MKPYYWMKKILTLYTLDKKKTFVHSIHILKKNNHINVSFIQSVILDEEIVYCPFNSSYQKKKNNNSSIQFMFSDKKKMNLVHSIHD